MYQSAGVTGETICRRIRAPGAWGRRVHAPVAQAWRVVQEREAVPLPGRTDMPALCLGRTEFKSRINNFQIMHFNLLVF